MARRGRRKKSEKPGPSGFLVVDKPAGITSHDVVDAARKWLGTRRVGHLGTLDPQATGVLPLAVRAATKLVPFLESGAKSYVGTIVLGVETDTLDREGEIVERFEGELPARAVIDEALDAFRGDVQQVPPMYSAVKKDGVPLHKLAREGREVEREPKWVRIEKLEVLRYEPPDLEVRVDCSAGTYVRVIAADLGAALGCGAHLGSLRRIMSGPFTLADALDFEKLEAAYEKGEANDLLIPPARALGYPTIEVHGSVRARLFDGAAFPAEEHRNLAPGSRVSAVDEDGELIAVTEVRADRRLWPLRVLPRD